MEVAALLDVVLKTPHASEDLGGGEPSRPTQSPSTDFAAMLAKHKEGASQPATAARESVARPSAQPQPDASGQEDIGDAARKTLVEDAATAPGANMAAVTSPPPSTQAVVPQGAVIDTTTLVKLADAAIQGNAPDEGLPAATGGSSSSVVNELIAQNLKAPLDMAKLEQAVVASLAANASEMPLASEEGARLASVLMQQIRDAASSSADSGTDDVLAALNASQEKPGDFTAWLKTLGFATEEGTGIVETEPVSSAVPDSTQPGASDKKAPIPDARPALGVAQLQDGSAVKPGSAAPVAPAHDQATLAILDQVAVRGIRYLATQQEKTITIHLVPQSLGELRLEVSAAQDGMHVRLMSPNPVVRDALEGQLSALKESLARNGIEVAKVSVLPGMTGYASNHYSAGNGGANFTPAPAARASGASLRQEAEYAASNALQHVSLHEGSLNVYV